MHEWSTTPKASYKSCCYANGGRKQQQDRVHESALRSAVILFKRADFMCLTVSGLAAVQAAADRGAFARDRRGHNTLKKRKRARNRRRSRPAKRSVLKSVVSPRCRVTLSSPHAGENTPLASIRAIQPGMHCGAIRRCERVGSRVILRLLYRQASIGAERSNSQASRQDMRQGLSA